MTIQTGKIRRPAVGARQSGAGLRAPLGGSGFACPHRGDGQSSRVLQSRNRPYQQQDYDQRQHHLVLIHSSFLF